MKSIALTSLAMVLAACSDSLSPGLTNEKNSPPALARSNVASSTGVPVTVLPSLGGSASARAINDAGTIVGTSVEVTRSSSTSYAIKWTVVNGAWTIAKLPGGQGAAAYAINGNETIVGQSSERRAVMWTLGGGPVVLGCPQDVGPDYALGINTQETVVGARSDVSPGRAVVWTKGGCREDLPSLPNGGGSAEARAINDGGTVAGHAYDAANNEWAVVWTRETDPATMVTTWVIHQLDAPGQAGAWNINGAGNVVGSFFPCVPGTGTCRAHAMLWPAGSAGTDLGTLGGALSAAFGINTAGEIVGYSYPASPPGSNNNHAFVWWPTAAGATTGTMQDLGTLGNDTDSEAYGINTNRQVVGLGLNNHTGSRRALLWPMSAP